MCGSNLCTGQGRARCLPQPAMPQLVVPWGAVRGTREGLRRGREHEALPVPVAEAGSGERSGCIMNLARSIRNPAASRIRPFCPAETAPHCKPPTVTLVPSVVDADVASAAMRVAWAARDGGAGRPWPLGRPARRARAARARGCVRGALLGRALERPFPAPGRARATLGDLGRPRCERLPPCRWRRRPNRTLALGPDGHRVGRLRRAPGGRLL